MVVDLKEAVDLGNYFNHLHFNSTKNTTDILLGKYKDAINLPKDMSSVEFIQSCRNQRYERNLY
jgi:hypothetical protein